MPSDLKVPLLLDFRDPYLLCPDMGSAATQLVGDNVETTERAAGTVT